MTRSQARLYSEAAGLIMPEIRAANATRKTIFFMHYLQ
jgi:hypothetical protein